MKELFLFIKNLTLKLFHMIFQIKKLSDVSIIPYNFNNKLNKKK